MTFPLWAGRKHSLGLHTYRVLWARVLTAGLLGGALILGASAAPKLDKSQVEAVAESPPVIAAKISAEELELITEAVREAPPRRGYI